MEGRGEVRGAWGHRHGPLPRLGVQVYEQEREERDGSSALGMYVRRWVRWASGGLAPAGGSGSVPSFVYAGFYAALS